MNTRRVALICFVGLVILGAFETVLQGRSRPGVGSVTLNIRLVAYQQDVWPDPALNTDVLSIFQMIAVPARTDTGGKRVPNFIKVQYHFDASEDKEQIEDIKKSGGTLTVVATRARLCDETIEHMDHSSGVKPSLVTFPGWKKHQLPKDLKLKCYVAFSSRMTRVK
jgi:hypothetical protein